MKTTTLKNRLQKANLLTKSGNLKNGYDNDLDRIQNLKGKTTILHLKTWNRTCGHMNLDTRKHDRTIELLNAISLKYKIGNDAPRGGAIGDFIIINSTELKKLPVIK